MAVLGMACPRPTVHIPDIPLFNCFHDLPWPRVISCF